MEGIQNSHWPMGQSPAKNRLYPVFCAEPLMGIQISIELTYEGINPT